MSLRRSLVARDQEVTPFSSTLMRFCEGTAALGAALVNGLGETVDYAGSVEPFDIKVAAAEWQLVLAMLRTPTARRRSSSSCFSRARPVRCTRPLQRLRDASRTTDASPALAPRDRSRGSRTWTW